jgi:hypothetical protein
MPSQLPNRDRCVAEVVQLLVAGRYIELATLSQSVRLTATELESAVTGYGRTLVLPSGHAKSPDFVRVERVGPERWSVVAPLYTLEEGLSDLSLELTLVRDSGAKFGYRVELDNLHVM